MLCLLFETKKRILPGNEHPQACRRENNIGSEKEDDESSGVAMTEIVRDRQRDTRKKKYRHRNLPIMRFCLGQMRELGILLYRPLLRIRITISLFHQGLHFFKRSHTSGG